MIQRRAMMVMERQVIVAAVVLILMNIIAVVQCDESREVQFFASGLMLQVMGE